MFDVRASNQEMRRNDNSHILHPKSAPIKPDPDASAGPMNYGGHIYSMFQGDEATRQKKLQQKAYFQELTRQVQEKKDKPIDPTQSTTFSGERNLMYSGNFASEISKLPFVAIDDEKKYPRYQKKYEIENHVGINVNTSQVFGGVLQRDEAMILKMKKEEQQKEMQNILSRQIQEKNRKREEEQAWKRRIETEQVDWSRSKDLDETPTSPRKPLEITSSPLLKPSEASTSSKTLSVFNKEEEAVDNMELLNEVVKKLLEEKAQLASKVMEQERKITDLHKRNSLNFEEDFEFPVKSDNFRSSKNEKPERVEKHEKTEKPKSRPPKSRIQSAQEVKIKVQHDEERAKLAVIEERLENARKKRIEQTKTRAVQKPRRISDSQARVDSRETLVKAPRIKTAASPTPKLSAFIAESPKITTKPEMDRHNLDSAGKSDFIYPDANGNYSMGDEIDKFVTDYENRELPVVSFKSPYRSSPMVECDARFTTTSMIGSARREIKPLVANKQGFPSDIFRLP